MDKLQYTIQDKVSKILKEDHLTTKDKEKLVKEGPVLIRRVQVNIKNNKEPFDKMDIDSKVTLLAYVVLLRQNIAMENDDKINDVDAAMILHGKVYNDKDEKELDKNLKKQLAKIGIK